MKVKAHIMPRKAPPLRLASVAGDNAFGDVDVGANVGKGQHFGLTTPKPRIVFDETKLADAAFSFSKSTRKNPTQPPGCK